MQSPLTPLEVSLRATRSRESSTAADREIRRITEGKMRKGNGSATTTNSTNSCATKRRPGGGRATARTDPGRRGTIMAILTVLMVETNWERRTGRIWVTGRHVSETR